MLQGEKDPYGDGSRHLVTIERASLGTLARRPAEPHPGVLDGPVGVGIRVKKKDYRVFDTVGQKAGPTTTQAMAARAEP